METVVTGGNGMLGGYLLALRPAWRGPGSKELDVADERSVMAALERYQPKALINCAAARSFDSSGFTAARNAGL